MDNETNKILDILSKVDHFFETDPPDDEKRIRCTGFYKRHLMDLGLDPKVACLIFDSFFRHCPEEAKEIFKRWSDALPFVLGGPRSSNFIKIVSGVIINHQSFDPEEKLMMVENIFERSFIDHCYPLFAGILQHPAPERVVIECCKYLYLSRLSEYQTLVQEKLQSVLTSDIASDKKLGILCDFSGKRIRFYHRMQGIFVVHDDESIQLLCVLYLGFVMESTHQIQDRILASGYLLKNATPDVQRSVERMLLDWGQDQQLAEVIRATAYDQLILASTAPEVVEKACLLLQELGYSSVTKRIKTVYDSSQNVHHDAITTSALNFAQALYKEILRQNPLPNIREIMDPLEKWILQQHGERKYKIRKSLHRIMVDPSTFTTDSISLQELLYCVWTKVRDSPDLIQRLMDELEEMNQEPEGNHTDASVCSSGFAVRLVNVLHGENNNVITIDWEDQIRANVQARLYASIKNLEEGETKDSVLMGMMDGADVKNAADYDAFCKAHREPLYDELYQEFVGQGHVSKELFDHCFDQTFPETKNME